MKMKKIISMVLIFIMFICLFSATVFAKEISDLIESSHFKEINKGDTTESGITDAIDSILGLVQIAGTGIALIAVSLLGIKYMLSSVEEKAEIKKYMVGIVIGAILVFGGVGVAQLLANFSDDIFGTGT